MDWWTRLTGPNQTSRKAAPKSLANDPQARLSRFKQVFNTVLELVNKPRNPLTEGPLLEQLKVTTDRLVVLIREETRASIPHLCLQYAAASQIYTVIGRAAIVSQHEPVTLSSVALFAALVDSEEEDFLASPSFAKTLMRLVTKVIDSGNVLIGVETETAILELLFTISAKIRLQPEILPVWFRSSAKPELEDVFVKEKKSFVGVTSKADFPLCYLLIDRVHHDGRIGDFARTGLLYIFEATGRSLDLEEWVVSSDLPTLMASGLGALYSQLSRELSILHPDATLPAVLAMSDYSTTHAKATAESAFSDRHQGHMATFLSYLLFWQDVLDHCRSADVKQTSLDHFQILFLQQLLYPSLLQSSDTDAGSSVAVLTYMTAMLEALEYPDLIQMMLSYLLAIPEGGQAMPSTPATPVRPSMPPRSPTTLRRRQSLMLLTAPKDPEQALEPTLFNLTDLVLNGVRSQSAQTAFASLKLVSVMLARHRQYAFGSLLKVRNIQKAPQLLQPHAKQQDEDGPSLANSERGLKAGREGTPALLLKTVGAFEIEVQQYMHLATAFHGDTFPEETYESVCDDMRYAIEAQVPFVAATEQQNYGHIGLHTLSSVDPLLQAIRGLLRTFFTNSIDVNLALTEAIITQASCLELRLDAWIALDPSKYTFSTEAQQSALRPWQAHLDEEESRAWFALQHAYRRPTWTDDNTPQLYTTLAMLAKELSYVRTTAPNLDHLLAARQHMLQASSMPANDGPLSEPPPLVSSPIQTSFLDTPTSTTSQGHSRSSSTSSLARGRNIVHATNRTTFSPRAPLSRGQAASPPSSVLGPNNIANTNNSIAAARSIFQPPPPEQPSTTGVLMQKISFPRTEPEVADHVTGGEQRSASLNHVLTNIVVLQQFVLELIAVLQVRASVLGEREVRYA